MNKIWKFNDSKSNKLILIKDKIIYKGNPKDIDLNLQKIYKKVRNS